MDVFLIVFLVLVIVGLLVIAYKKMNCSVNMTNSEKFNALPSTSIQISKNNSFFTTY